MSAIRLWIILTLLALLCGTAAAQEMETLPENPFLSGLWVPAQRQSLTAGNDYVVDGAPPHTFNRPLTHHDRLALDLVNWSATDEAYVFEYRGAYDHFHVGARTIRWEPLGYNSRHWLAWDCSPQSMSYPVVATATWYRDQFSGELTGRSDVSIVSDGPAATPPHEHGVGVAMRNEGWRYQQYIRYPPFLDPAGNFLDIETNFYDPMGAVWPLSCYETHDINVQLSGTSGVYYATLRMPWRRLPVRPEDLVGSILGEVGAGTDDAQKGRVTAYLQKRPVPARDPMQSIGEYLGAHPDVFEAKARAEIDAEGNFQFGALPLFYTDGGLRSANYMLVIEGAEIKPPASPDFIPLRPGLFSGLAPYAENPLRQRFELQPDDFLSAKRHLIRQIIEKAPTNLGPPEAQMAGFINVLAQDVSSVTDEQREAVRRAAWAERFVLEGLLQADSALKVMMSRVAKLVVYALSKLPFLDGKSDEIKAGEKAQERLKNAEASVLPGFKEQFRTESAKKIKEDTKLNNELMAARRSQNASVVKSVLSLFATLLQKGMIYAGVAQGQAATAKTAFETVTFLLLDMMINESPKGALVQAFNLVLTKVIEGFALVFLDNRFELAQLVPGATVQFDLDSMPSFAGWITDATQFSVDQALAHNVADPAAYDEDATNAARALNRLIADGTEFEQLLIKIALVADTSEEISGVFDAFATFGVSQAKILKAFFEGAGVGGSLALVTTTLGRVLFQLPQAVEEGVALAWGVPSIMSHGDVRGVELDSRVVAEFQAAAQDFEGASDSVRFSLRQNDFDTAYETIYLADGAYRLSLEELHRTSERLRAYLAVTEGAEEALVALNTLRPMLEMESRWIIELDELLADLYEGKFASNSEPEWISRRDRLAMVIAELGQRVADVSDRVASVELTGTTLPLVVVQSAVVTSDATGLDVVRTAGETFTARARVAVVGLHEAADVNVVATVQGPSGILITPNSPVSLGTLSAADDDPAGGSDQADVEWTIELPEGVEPTDAAFAVDIALQEGNTPSRNWMGVGSGGVVIASPEHYDGDDDGLPDAWEDESGTDSSTADQDADPDGDGLDNAAEFRYETDPQSADSDGDGLDDLSEIFGRTTGFKTDPNVADTDGDGVDDGTDGAPIDWASTQGQAVEEPKLVVSQTIVELDADNPIAFIDVSNSGSGRMAINARAADPYLVDVSPKSATETGKLMVSALNLDFGTFKQLETEIFVWEAVGSDPDPTVVTIVLNGTAVPNEPLPELPEEAGTTTDPDQNEESEGQETNDPWWLDDDRHPYGGPGSSNDSEGSSGGAKDGCCAVVSSDRRRVPLLPLGFVLVTVAWRRRRR